MYATRPFLGQCSINWDTASSQAQKAWEQVEPIIDENWTGIRKICGEIYNFVSPIIFCVLVAVVFNLLSLFLMGKIAEIMFYMVLFVAEIMFICSISALAYMGLRSEYQHQAMYFWTSVILFFMDCIFNIMLYSYWDDIGLGRQLIDIG